VKNLTQSVLDKPGSWFNAFLQIDLLFLPSTHPVIRSDEYLFESDS
jgi:hypothetical protein